MAAMELSELLRIIVVDVPERPRLRPYIRGQTFESMSIHLRMIDVAVSTRFRFQSFTQLRRLLAGFRFPTGKITLKHGYKIEAEELIMISLTRLSFPYRWSDLYERFPGRKRWFMKAAFYWFLDFMIVNWGYLLLNNMDYWKPYLAQSCEAIRVKLMNLNWVNWRQYHPPAHEPGGFRFCGFIDNTMFAFSRPGGNTDGGSAAPRVPKEIQQAWWTGWKKFHGMKWQTVILANGMDLNVFGPLSARKNDLTSLEKSNFEDQFTALQAGNDIKYKIHGDSAYYDNKNLGTGGGRGMASVRETVEWTYKDDKGLWKYLDYKHVLKLRNQPVAKIMFVCMLLRNAYVTMNGSQVSEYLISLPPSFEHWVSQGPSARPLPNNSIFSNDFIYDSDDDSSEDEDEFD